MNTDAVRVIQLTVLASIVDGEASGQEIDAIAAGVAERFDDVSVDAAKALATKMVEAYKAKGYDKNPVAVVRKGGQAMRRLSGRNKRAAMKISKAVAAASGGVEASETQFLEELSRVAG